MITSADFDALVERLKEEEGFRATPYRDPRGFLTVGYGTNLEAGITRRQAEDLLRDALVDLEDELITYPWFMSLPDARQMVILDMAYNMGVGGVLTFQHMIEALQAGNWNAAAQHMLNSEWAVQVGERAQRLARIMRTGIWE